MPQRNPQRHLEDLIPTVKLILKPEREKSLRRRHPWIFSGAVARVDGAPPIGDTVEVYSTHGQFFAHAAYSPHSQIVGRVWNFDREEAIDGAFVTRRIIAAARRRDSLLASGMTDSARLIHGESDGLPGLVVDRYRDGVVVQLLAAGAERWREEIIAALSTLEGARWGYERSDADVRQLEGLEPRTGTLFGEVPDSVEIHEHGLAYDVDFRTGQKTGFYLDQRDNRAQVARYAEGRSVLNAFCYTGGFTLNALRNGALSVLSVDSSPQALRQGESNVARNGLDQEHATWVEGDVFKVLRDLRDRDQHFDLIVLDPPKFAPTPASIEKASRGYKDINLFALKLLNIDGVLATFSCSGGVNADLFQKIVAGAAADAEVEAQIIDRLTAAEDHPVSIHFPEGEYLKGLVLRRIA